MCIHLHITSFLPGHLTDTLDVVYPDFKLSWFIDIFSSPCISSLSMIFLRYHVSLRSIHIYPPSLNYLTSFSIYHILARPAQMHPSFSFPFFVFLKNFYKTLSQNWWPILGSEISSAPNVSFLKELFLLPPNRKSIICVLLTVLSELFIYSNGFPALICMLLRGSDNVSFNTVSQPLHM